MFFEEVLPYKAHFHITLKCHNKRYMFYEDDVPPSCVCIAVMMAMMTLTFRASSFRDF
jgi:hypothetical protein